MSHSMKEESPFDGEGAVFRPNRLASIYGDLQRTWQFSVRGTHVSTCLENVIIGRVSVSFGERGRKGEKCNSFCLSEV